MGKVMGNCGKSVGKCGKTLGIFLRNCGKIYWNIENYGRFIMVSWEMAVITVGLLG